MEGLAQKFERMINEKEIEKPTRENIIRAFKELETRNYDRSI